MLKFGQKRSKDIAALAAEQVVLGFYWGTSIEITGDPEGVPGSYNLPWGGECLGPHCTFSSGQFFRSAYICAVMLVQAPNAAITNLYGLGPASAPPVSVGSPANN